MRLTSKVITSLRPVALWWKTLLPRERRIVIAGSACLSLLGVYLIIDSAIGYVQQQTRALMQSQQVLREVEQDLSTYTQLVKRKENLETHFRNIEIKEGVRTLIERILREKGEVKETPLIRDLPTTSLGEKYDVVQYSVNFSIGSMKSLAALLKELVHGEKPVLITQLDIKKNVRTADKVDVLINVSSIKPKAT